MSEAPLLNEFRAFAMGQLLEHRTRDEIIETWKAEYPEVDEKGLKAILKAIEKEQKEKEKEKPKPHRVFVKCDGVPCLTVMDKTGKFKFCYLYGSDPVFENTIQIDGIEYQPQTLPERDGELIHIVGVPFEESIKEATSIEIKELCGIIESHLKTYIDAPDTDIEMFVNYILFTWFYQKTNTVPYLRILGDTGKGKSRIQKVIGDLCYYPITAEGASTASGIMRFKEKWHGTLIIDEADLKSGDFSNELVKYVNLGFERGKYFIKTDKENLKEQEIFDPFGPKIFAMREPFRDNATEGRCLSFSPQETTRKDIPIILPARYEETVHQIRGTITRFVLEQWNAVDGEKMIDCADMQIEPRLKQLTMPLSIVLQITSEGKERFKAYIHRRQVEIKKTRAESWEGTFFNTVYALAIGDEKPDDEFSYLVTRGEGLPMAITAAMVAKSAGTTPAKVTRALKSIGFEIELFRAPIPEKPGKSKVVRRLAVPNSKTWEEILQRYFVCDDQITLGCFENLKSGKFVTLVTDVTLPRETSIQDLSRIVVEGASKTDTSSPPQSVTSVTSVTFKSLTEKIQGYTARGEVAPEDIIRAYTAMQDQVHP